MTANTCGCCDPVAGLVPQSLDNRPGLSAIAYRVGTYSSFRESLLEAIAGTPELAPLSTRLSDDYAITVFELWSTVADVVAFYQERIANEGFLRTAHWRDSVMRLARLIDYQMRPGVAATALLAFTLEKGGRLTIPIGLRAQSVPGPDEKPQKFQTIESITADARFNRLRILPPPTADPDVLAKGRNAAILRPASALSIAAALKPGDRFVLFSLGGSENVEEKRVEAVEPVEERVVLRWSPDIEGTEWVKATTIAYKFTRTLKLFGCNAPEQSMLPDSAPAVAGGIKWSLYKTEFGYPDASTSTTSTLDLDAVYDELTPGMQLLVDTSGGAKTLVTIKAVKRAPATMTSSSDPPIKLPPNESVTQISVKPAVPRIPNRRQALIYVLSGPRIRFWPCRYGPQITGSPIYVAGLKINSEKIEIDRKITGTAFQPGSVISLKEVEVGRSLLLTDGPANIVESTLKAVQIESVQGQDFLVLEHAPQGALSLDASAATLLGNVTRGSHGETVKDEVLGDGDAGAKFQSLALKKQPLTYLPSGSAGGVESTLQVRVNRVGWKEVPSLYGQAASGQVYATRTGDDGTSTVQFGDGVTGAPALSGRGNVTAAYRYGSGLVGRVRAATLTTLLDRPVGLKSVTNPLAAEGGADPETADTARAKAPLTVRTFGRVVALRDFEDVAMESGEVAKARATWVWTGEGQVVHLTVAGQQAAVFSVDALQRIHAALDARRDPNHLLFVDNFMRIPIAVSVTLHVLSTNIATDVATDAREALLAFLSFEHLQFGEAVNLSDIYAVLQGVPGVDSLTVDGLQFKMGLLTKVLLAMRGADLDPVQPRLRIYPARPAVKGSTRVLPAEQAWVESPPQDLTIGTVGGLPE